MFIILESSEYIMGVYHYNSFNFSVCLMFFIIKCQWGKKKIERQVFNAMTGECLALSTRLCRTSIKKDHLLATQITLYFANMQLSSTKNIPEYLNQHCKNKSVVKSYNFKILGGITLHFEIRNRPLVSLTHKELLQLRAKKTRPIQKWANDLTRQLSKEDIYRWPRNRKRFLALLAIRKCKPKPQ